MGLFVGGGARIKAEKRCQGIKGAGGIAEHIHPLLNSASIHVFFT